MAQLSESAKVALASAYASLLLSDAGVAVTAANINKVLTGAKLVPSAATATSIEKVVNVSPVANFIGSIGSGSAPAAQAPVASAPAPVVKKEEPKKEEPKEEETDMDMGDLFG